MIIGNKSWAIILIAIVLGTIFTLESVLHKDIVSQFLSDSIQDKNVKAKRAGRDLNSDLSYLASELIKTECGKQPIKVLVQTVCENTANREVCLSYDTKNTTDAATNTCSWFVGKAGDSTKYALLDLYDVYGNGNTLSLIAQANLDLQ